MDFRRDSLNYNGKLKSGTAIQLMVAKETIESNLSQMKFPYFILHGEELVYLIQCRSYC